MKIDDPKIKAKIEFDAAGGENCKVIIPREWLGNMGLSPEWCNATLAFDGQRITLVPAYRSYHSRIERIHAFALVWLQLFRLHDQISHHYFYSFMSFAQAMDDLGFGPGNYYFHRVYRRKEDEDRYAMFKRVIGRINDIELLGCLIYCRWEEFNSIWGILDYTEEDFEWFVLALTRLAEISADPKSVRTEKDDIARCKLCYGKNAEKAAED